MPQKDWNAIEWVLESCLPEREYDPSRTSLEEQQELRKLMAPRIDPYLRSVEADLHLMGDYMIENGMTDALINKGILSENELCRLVKEAAEGNDPLVDKKGE